jgi:hypothetical protein
MATCQSGRLPRGLGNTKSHVRNFERVSTTFSAGLDNGTPCSRPALVRTTGIVHTLSPKSISDQRAPSISPVRVAVSMQASRARAATVGSARRFFMKADRSRWAIAAWWPRLGFPRFGRRCERWPRHTAGFSPWRCPWALAALRTASMRPQSRAAVSGFSIQSGFKTPRTASVSISSTSRDLRAAAPVVRLQRH